MACLVIPTWFGMNSLARELAPRMAIASFVGSMQVSGMLAMLCLLRLLSHGVLDPLALCLIITFLTLALIPLAWTDAAWMQKLIAYACVSAETYFPARVIVEEESAFCKDSAYVLGLSPHSAMPTALPVVFSLASKFLPKVLRGRCHGVASSVCFLAPLVRQIFYASGVRPATHECISALLSARKAVVVIPGGVQEVLAMTHGNEDVVYLTKRRGFVKMALRHNAPLVPVFAFGQTATYTWSRPGPHVFPFVPENWVTAISRAAGFVPLMMYGVMGTPIPHKVPLCVVIGRPIPLPVTPRRIPAVTSDGERIQQGEAVAAHVGKVTHPCKAAVAAANDCVSTKQKQPALGVNAHRETIGADKVELESCNEAGDANAGTAVGKGVAGVVAEADGADNACRWEEGDEETVQLYLKQYISALEIMYEKHKVAAGCKGRQLIVL